MSKVPDLSKIQSQVEKLPLHDLLTLQKFIVEKIAEQEKEAQTTIDKAKEVLEQIRTNNGGNN